MRKIIIGSVNPIKIEAVKTAFSAVFPGESFEYFSHEAISGVPAQPIGHDETKLGAKNRADDCRRTFPDADFFVGLEGGVEEHGDELWALAWMCVQNTNGVSGYGRTGSFLLPSRVHELIAEGKELGMATDIVFNDTNSKHKGGAIGALTCGVINRKDLYFPAVVFALIPFVHPELYGSNTP